ncbi:MAG TPA: 1-phosphofructokinase, partial [Erysipelotrichaceae bacterium]|nr:1-phosphofructokinase [Erysipelotrichaceae bacterium]
AGDSLVAGFLAAYLETEDPVNAFCYGVACGSGSAFSSSFVTRMEADALVQSITPRKIR